MDFGLPKAMLDTLYSYTVTSSRGVYE